MMVSNRNLLFQGYIFRCELLVSGRVTKIYKSNKFKQIRSFPRSLFKSNHFFFLGKVLEKENLKTARKPTEVGESEWLITWMPWVALESRNLKIDIFSPFCYILVGWGRPQVELVENWDFKSFKFQDEFFFFARKKVVVFRWPPRAIIFFGIFPRSRCDGFLQRGGWSGQVFRETSFECQLLSAFVTDDLLLSILGSTFFFHFHSVHIDENIAAWFTSLITIHHFRCWILTRKSHQKNLARRVLHMCWTSVLLGSGILGSLDSTARWRLPSVKLLQTPSEKHVIHPFLFGGQGSLFQIDPTTKNDRKKQTQIRRFLGY